VDGQGAIEIDGESIAGTYSVAGWDDNSYRGADDQVKLTVDGDDRLYGSNDADVLTGGAGNDAKSARVAKRTAPRVLCHTPENKGLTTPGRLLA